MAVQVGRQNGKNVLIGCATAADLIEGLRSEAISVNPQAQRSLARGAKKDTTRELLEDERAHKAPRIKELVKFLKRVMDEVEKGSKEQGFFGSLSLAVPHDYTGAKLHLVEPTDGLTSPAIALLQSALGNGRRLGVFVAEPGLGEPALHIGDGQGRCFGFYAFLQVAKENVAKQRKKVKKLEAEHKDTSEAKQELAELEHLRDRIQKYLSTTDIPFVIYIGEIKNDDSVVGVSEAAEKRMYVEGNALNSQATKEEVVRYETWSPVIIALQQDRELEDVPWMSPDFIEEDAKSIAAKSTKVFTLSTLVQAYSRSIIQSENAIRVSEEAFELVGTRHEFVKEYWKRITKLFGAIWVPPGLDSAERLKYLTARRDEQNVLFSAVMLQALGKLGHTLGKHAKWDPQSEELDALDKLKAGAPGSYAAIKSVAKDGKKKYVAKWTTAMMKERTDKKGAGTGEYSFNNTRDTVESTHALLMSTCGIVPVREDDDEDDLGAADDDEDDLVAASA